MGFDRVYPVYYEIRFDKTHSRATWGKSRTGTPRLPMMRFCSFTPLHDMFLLALRRNKKYLFWDIIISFGEIRLTTEGLTRQGLFNNSKNLTRRFNNTQLTMSINVGPNFYTVYFRIFQNTDFPDGNVDIFCEYDFIKKIRKIFNIVISICDIGPYI